MIIELNDNFKSIFNENMLIEIYILEIVLKIKIIDNHTFRQ